MDISKLNTVTTSEQGKWLDILDGDGVKTGIRIKVVGIDSKKFKSESQKLAKYLERQREEKNKDYDGVEYKTISMAVAITVDWENIEEDGKVLEFDKETGERVYTNAPIITEQVLRYAKDRNNFLSEKQTG
jgi:hypothetical protein